MVHTCGRCKRINPPEAAFCYFDGSALAGAPQQGKTRPAAGRLFPSHFVFPRGRACGTFDELAVACQEDWAAARELLQRGYFETFLQALGRIDLAQAASTASQFPDADRGLDQLLARLPTSVLESPKLRVNPLEVHLGQLQIGEDRAFEMHLENQGMRLLYGSVSSEDCPWLTLGDAKGAGEKHFQFGSEAVIPVHVQGKRLRAGVHPLEGRLFVDSNGGTATVTIRIDVPVKPFPAGVLAGAISPRQLAEKAKELPKEAAEYFQSGAVARWYKENGWTYPVSGPAFRGTAAVQQFFEVLGLSVPPRVELSEKSITLRGNRGDRVEHMLRVNNAEQRPKLVFARAVSNQPWLEIGRAKLNGQSASIPLVVPSVPDCPEEQIVARVAVVANGNQRFVVPVTLEVSGGNPRLDGTPKHSGDRPAPPNRAGRSGSDNKTDFMRGRSWVRLGWLVAAPVLLLLSVLGCCIRFFRGNAR